MQAQYDATPHNPMGLGWKQHGKDGRFVQKPQKFDHDGAIIGCLLGVVVALVGCIFWILNEATKINYPR